MPARLKLMRWRINYLCYRKDLSTSRTEGKLLMPLAVKAVLLHGCDDGGHDRAEVGWGRMPSNMNDIVLTDEHAAHIVYQGEVRPASWGRMQIPIPRSFLTSISVSRKNWGPFWRD
jgi:hypothetical protein